MTRHPTRHSIGRRASPWRRTLLALAALVLLYLLYAGVQTYRHVASLRAHAWSLKNQAMSHPAIVGEELRAVRGDVTRLRRDLWPLLGLARGLGWLPWIGPTLAAGPDLFDAGTLYLDAGIAAWDAAGEPLAQGMADDLGLQEVAPAMIRAIAAEREALDGAALNARGAAQIIDGIDAGRLLPPLREPLARVQGVLPLITAGFEGLPLLPALAPAEGTRTYVLLAQNNDELRATGGFISSIGTLTFVDGVPAMGSMQDSYAVEDWSKAHPDPPEALRTTMGIDLWTTRDGNWSPDFPTSARDVAELYALNQDTAVHGVIAVDMAAAVRLLEVLTPLKLDGGQVVEPGQVAETFRQSWSLPEGALTTPGVVVTATHDFEAIELELVLDDRTGAAWFDSVRLEDLSDAGKNLVRNPSFEELDAATPRHWAATGLGAADGVTTDHAHAGSRSYAMQGESGRRKVLSQRIAQDGSAGTPFVVAAESRAEEVNNKGGDYCLRVTFLCADGTRQTETAHFPVLTHDWATAGTDALLWEWWHQRKGVIGDMMAAAQRAVISDPQRVPWLSLGETLHALLLARGIQTHLFDADLAAYLQAQGWNGAMVAAGQDYLNVVECNTGYNKVSTEITRAMTYTVTLDDVAAPSASLELHYRHNGEAMTGTCDKFKDSLASTYEGLRGGCYWAYIRVYAPAGATLTACEGGDGACTTLHELGRTAFATSIELRPGGSGTVRLDYQLPPGVIRAGTYALYLQRQAGIPPTPVVVRFGGARAPDEVMVVPTSPDHDGVTRDGAAYLDLPQDQTVTGVVRDGG